MKFWELVVIAVGLSMDAMAVSATQAACTSGLRARHVVVMAITFGLFQAAMPLLGWGAAEHLAAQVAAYGPWLAFAILAAVGANMIRGSLSKEVCADGQKVARRGAARKEAEPKGAPPLRLTVLFALAVATSIDAFVVGLTLPFLGVSPRLAVVVIGATTAALSFVGARTGRLLGRHFGEKLNALGGTLLVLIGLKILLASFLAGRS